MEIFSVYIVECLVISVWKQIFLHAGDRKRHTVSYYVLCWCL